MFKKKAEKMKKIVSLTLGIIILLSGCGLDIDMNSVPKENEIKKSETASVIVIHPIETQEADPQKDSPDETGEEQGPPKIPDEPDDTQTPPPAVSYGLVEASDACEDAYFNDAVFIGDSISLMLSYYARDQRKDNPDFLGGAQFLTSGSFSYRNAVLPVSENSIHPSYQGEKMLVEDAISLIGAKKIYIMLGMNDIAGRNYTVTFDSVNELISRIVEKSPDVVFYLESVTPRMDDAQTQKLNNEIIREWNEKLKAYCEEKGHFFLNVYEAVADGNNNLKAEYCSDPVSAGEGCMGIHMTYAGCEKWVEYLYTHTATVNG